MEKIRRRGMKAKRAAKVGRGRLGRERSRGKMMMAATWRLQE